jgi:hypothetical protein
VGQATPDKSHQWGAGGIVQGQLFNTRWFAERSNAVTHAKRTFGKSYAIARAWMAGQDASAHR